MRIRSKLSASFSQRLHNNKVARNRDANIIYCKEDFPLKWCFDLLILDTAVWPKTFNSVCIRTCIRIDKFNGMIADYLMFVAKFPEKILSSKVIIESINRKLTTYHGRLSSHQISQEYQV